MSSKFRPVHVVRLTQGRYASAAISADGDVQLQNERGEYVTSEPASDYTREIAKLAIALHDGEGDPTATD